MPDRIIRDELLRSHRYVTLPSDTHRVLFFHLMLDADDFGNAEATTTSLGFLLARHISEEVAASLLGALADNDLVRIYLIDGKRYVHIPRYRQRLRITKEKHPRPPEHIDDLKNSNLKPNVRHAPANVSHVSVEVKRSEVKRSEEKKDLPPPVDNFDKPQVKTILEKRESESKPMTREEQIAFVAAKSKH